MRPPPSPHVFLVKREYLENLVEVDKLCIKSRRPVVYLAASAGSTWYVVGPVPPTPNNCIPVTFEKAFPDASSAVGELVDYAMKIFRFYPRWFKTGVIEEAGLCHWPEFYYLCHEEERQPHPAGKRAKEESGEGPQPGEGPPKQPRRRGLRDVAEECLKPLAEGDCLLPRRRLEEFIRCLEGGV